MATHQSQTAPRKRINGVPEVAVALVPMGRDLAITVHVEMEKYHLAKDRSHGGVLTRRRIVPPPGFKRAIAQAIQALVDGHSRAGDSRGQGAPAFMPFPDLTPDQAKEFEAEERYEL
jgi:hypothetical protein